MVGTRKAPAARTLVRTVGAMLLAAGVTGCCLSSYVLPASPQEAPAASGAIDVAPESILIPTAPVQPPAAPTSAISTALKSGTASTYGPGWNGWLALPEGPGIRVRICGPAACVTRTSTDAGPDLAMQRKGRIVDLDVPAFEAVCGCGWRRGLVQVTVEYLP